ncbi:ABC transporter permease [Lutibaculum baratangense]|nr:ABC transporter permease [Lutibaculum baratangense]
MRKHGWLGVYAVAYLVFLYAPVLLLPLFAFNDGTIIAFPLKGFSTRWFEELWQTAAVHRAVENSLYVGLATAVISTTLGIFAARAGARYAFPGKRGILGFIMLPLVLPEIIIATSLLVVLVQLGFGLSLGLVVLGHVLLCLPFSISILNASFQGFDRNLEEASQDLGESALMTFWRVTLPLVTPGIIASLLISFTISLDEFIIAFFLTGTEPTLPVYIWSQLRFTAKLPSMMALGFLLLLFSLVLLVTAEYFRRRSRARASGGDPSGGMM